MPLTEGQKNELIALLIQTDNEEGLPSTILSKELNVDEQVLVKSIVQMQELTYELIFTRHCPETLTENEFYMVKIPNGEKYRAEQILSSGGWGKIQDEYFRKRDEEKKATERRLRLEENSWEAAVNQANAAERQARRSNFIAIVAVLIALATFILQLAGVI